MKRKKTKDYWEKVKEPFDDNSEARSRAAELRINEHTSYVKVAKMDPTGKYVVSYCVAKWYLQELKDAGVEL